MIDRELNLPRSWTDDHDRLAKAGVPADIEFLTKPALATGMITCALNAGVPAGGWPATRSTGPTPPCAPNSNCAAPGTCWPSAATAASGPTPGRCAPTNSPPACRDRCGNGWIGGYVGEVLIRRGWQVTGVSRTPEAARARHPDWAWVGMTGEDLELAIERAGAVINLAGRHVLEQPWTPHFVREMRDSRIETTRRVVAALHRTAATTPVLISASGYPVYGDTGDELITEQHTISRALISGAMDADWEDTARAAAADGVRVVLLRLGLVLGHNGGAFPVLRQPFDGGTGVVLGTGRQWTPWIHIDDAARLIADTVDDPHYRGPVNVVAPHPARHADLAAALAAPLVSPTAQRCPAIRSRTPWAARPSFFSRANA